MGPLADLPPTRRADLRIDEATRRRAVRSGELLPLRRGVVVGRNYVAQSTASHIGRHVLQVQVASAVTRGAPLTACLGTAALFHGLQRLGRPAQRVRLYKERGGQWRDDRVAVLVCTVPEIDVVTIHDVRATSLPRTAADLARWVSFRSAVVVMDSALNLGAARQQINGVLDRSKHWPGVRKAREALAFADRGGTTVLESLSRVMLADLGLPRPDLQVPVVDGRDLVGVVDFLWRDAMVIGEADGLAKYGDPDALRKEKLRQERLEALGYIVVRWTWDDIWHRPAWVAGRIQGALARASRRSA